LDSLEWSNIFSCTHPSFFLPLAVDVAELFCETLGILVLKNPSAAFSNLQIDKMRHEREKERQQRLKQAWQFLLNDN